MIDSSCCCLVCQLLRQVHTVTVWVCQVLVPWLSSCKVASAHPSMGTRCVVKRLTAQARIQEREWLVMMSVAFRKKVVASVDNRCSRNCKSKTSPSVGEAGSQYSNYCWRVCSSFGVLSQHCFICLVLVVFTVIDLISSLAKTGNKEFS